MQQRIDSAVRLRERELDIAITTAWATARMSRFKKIHDLARYLKRGGVRESLPPPPEPERRGVMAAAKDWALQLMGGGAPDGQ